MLTKLLFPPQWIPTQPYLSLPSLTAFLRKNDQDVEQRDINMIFFDDLLSRKGLSGYYDIVSSRLGELESMKELPPLLQKEYAALGSCILFGDHVINNIDEAKKVLRDREKFFDIDELFRAFKILELGLKLASTAYYPTNLTFHSYDMRYSCRSSRDVLSAINDRKENIFIDYFEKRTIPEILEKRPDLVGISIINTSQLIPGLTLASLIKISDESIHINIGGSVLTRLVPEISRNRELFSIIDSVIVHEGETALLGLIKYLKNESDISKVPNLIYRDGDEIKVNRINSFGEDINSLPAPCFDGFPLDRYFSPELILPVLSSRGCYWNRCTFCDHGYGYSGKYRPRDVSLLYEDIKMLKNKYGTGFFTFQDEGLAPKSISALSDKIIQNSLEISWLADSRFEPAFSEQLGKKLAGAGCKMLYFGLESASDRVLACMDKGIKLENVLDICRRSADVGIWTHLFLIFGFPTETKKEAKETMDFILHNRDVIRSMSFGSFQLTKHSRVYENPGSYGISRIIRNDDIDLSLWYDYEAEKGMSRRETDELIQEFYGKLSTHYRDMPIWSNLDREHLFLYVSHFGGQDKVASLSALMDDVQKKRSLKRSEQIVTSSGDFYPRLNEGIFTGTFNFNLAWLIQSMMSGGAIKEALTREKTNVLFDTDNNRILTVSDLARDILDMSDGEFSLSQMIGIIAEKYRIPFTEAENKCRKLLEGLMEKNILDNRKK